VTAGGPLPSIAVVVPARDAAGLLPAQLDALSTQAYRGRWSVVVADNGSRDRTAAVAGGWADRLPGLVVVDVVDPGGPGHARNAGAAAVGDADLLAFCDADDVVSAGWLAGLEAGLRDHEAVGGRLEYLRLNPSEAVHWNHDLQSDGLPDSFEFLPYAVSANLGIRASAFRAVGGFDPTFGRACDDVDLCWRLQLAGHRLGYAPAAVVHYRFRGTVRGMARQAHAYGRAQPQLYRRYRAAGMSWSITGGLEPWGHLARSAPRVALRRSSGRQVVREAALRLGRARGSIEHRVLYL
jgi:GT2 family glycosyltransferase